MRTLAKIAPICLLLALACAEEAQLEGAILISAHESYLGASVVINGKEIGKLQHLAGHGSLYEAALKRVYGDDPTFHVVGTIVSLRDQALSPGVHEISVVAVGKPVARGPITYPPGTDVDQYFVSGDKIKVLAATAATAP